MITDSLMISRRQVLNFPISDSIRRKKKRLKRENVLWFKLLLEIKFILKRQTRQVFASGLHFSHIYKDRRLVDLCDNNRPILLTISRQEVLNFHISGSIRRRKAFVTGK